MKKFTKIALIVASFVLVAALSVGGTLAWLQAETEAVVNVFDPSNLGVELKETTESYEMVPSVEIKKDPYAKITAESEDAYLFIKVEETGGDVKVGDTTYDFDDFILYAIDEKWTALKTDDHSGIYYIAVDNKVDGEAATEKGVNHIILGDGKYIYNNTEYAWDDNEVLTKPEVTKEMMAAVANKKPTLTFTAYAIQMANGETIFTPEQAWAIVSPAQQG